jgi:hypothetical protein
MAVKATASFTGGMNYEDNGEFSPEVSIASGVERAIISVGPYDPSNGELAINAQIKADVKTHCQNAWGVSFLPDEDTVLLIGGVRLL